MNRVIWTYQQTCELLDLLWSERTRPTFEAACRVGFPNARQRFYNYRIEWLRERGYQLGEIPRKAGQPMPDLPPDFSELVARTRAESRRGPTPEAELAAGRPIKPKRSKLTPSERAIADYRRAARRCGLSRKAKT